MAERPCTRFAELSSQLAARDDRLPVVAYADLTYRCNFRCAHCFCRMPEHRRQASRELTFSEWDRILGECVDEGTLFLTISGGEALLHPDFQRIWVAAKRRGLIVELLSNAALITPAWVDFFADWPPLTISVSVYGATEQTYRAYTGLPGMYSRVREALDLLVGRGLRVSVKTVLTRRNVHEWQSLRDLLTSYDRVSRWDADIFGCLAEGGGAPLEERLSPAEIVALEQADPLRSAEWRRMLSGWTKSGEVPSLVFRCAVGRHTLNLDPYGNLHPCGLLESVSYDLRRGTVREGYREALPQLIATFPAPEGPCLACDIAAACRMCPARALLDGVSVTGPSPFYCDLGRLRIEAFAPQAEAAS